MEEILKKIEGYRLSAQTEAKWKRKCPCGYDPQSDSCSNENRCNVKLALQNHLSFPSFAMLSEYDDPSTLYYNLDSEFGFPIRHWALLFEIENKIGVIRPGCLGLTYFGEKVAVHFYHDKDDKPTTFKWDDLESGNTMAILYAERKTFLDLSEGVREENLDSCFIFKSNIQDVFKEANKLLKDADLRSANISQLECFGCGTKTDKILRCANCHLAKYCSKECQTKEWKSSHKKLCKQSDMLLRLSCLPRRKFNQFLTFKENQENTIPEYKQTVAAKKRENQNRRYRNVN